MRLPRAPGWALLLAALFAFRLWFGLSREFFFEDETQIFLIGFRYYATGEWPYFGPDVVWTKSEIPGALQGVLVGLPLRAAPYPESPYVALAILSFGALCLFAWYVGAHHPDVPRWLIWGWLFTIPWTIQFSLHLINTSYILPAALVFFVGVFESLPALSLGRIHPAVAHAMMGAALTWLMQIHMSWPLVLPFAALVWASRWRDGARAMALNLLSLFAGALAPALLLLPTLALHGAGAGSGGVVRNLHVHAVSPWILVTTLARLLSFASLEINRPTRPSGSSSFSGISGWRRSRSSSAWRASCSPCGCSWTGRGRPAGGRRRRDGGGTRCGCSSPAPCCSSTRATSSLSSRRRRTRSTSSRRSRSCSRRTGGGSSIHRARGRWPPRSSRSASSITRGSRGRRRRNSRSTGTAASWPPRCG